MDEQQLSLQYVASVIFAFGIGYAGLKHRGTITTDRTKHLNISNGDGLATKIVQYYPSYKTIAPAVDHCVAGISCTTGIGGVVGITLGSISPGLESSASMVPFYLAGAAYTFIDLAWEFETFFERPKGQYQLSDILQVGGSIVGTGSTLIILSNLFQ
ncbi:hypothetical protein HYV86_06610 [Candidatus Woesearchaeota archaeon]|nr:hypothetical protein [Candidatus Woesearchaeota archaeon]